VASSRHHKRLNTHRGSHVARGLITLSCEHHRARTLDAHVPPAHYQCDTQAAICTGDAEICMLLWSFVGSGDVIRGLRAVVSPRKLDLSTQLCCGAPLWPNGFGAPSGGLVEADLQPGGGVGMLFVAFGLWFPHVS
jgi:hypothetical protein